MLSFVSRLDGRMVVWTIPALLALLSAISAGCSSEPEVITVERTVEVIKEVPMEVMVVKEVVREVPVEVVVERVITKEVPVEVMVVKEVVREVPVEVVVERVITKEVPVEVIVEKVVVREVPVETVASEEVAQKTVEQTVPERPSLLTELWLIADSMELYRTSDSTNPNSFDLVNVLEFEDGYDWGILGMDFNSSGELWFLRNNGRGNNLHINFYDEDASGNYRRARSVPLDWAGGMAFDSNDHLWIAELERDAGARGVWFLSEFQSTNSGATDIIRHGRLDARIESVGDIAFHEGRMFISAYGEGAGSRLYEVPDPTVPDVAIEHVMPNDLGRPDGLASDGIALWILDGQGSNDQELWLFRGPEEIVEVGKTDHRGISRVSGLAFNKTQPTVPDPRVPTPPARDTVWVATSDSLHKILDTSSPQNITLVGELEGHFIRFGLAVTGIDFDAKGSLWILARSVGRYGGWHRVYRLDNIEDPRSAVEVAVLDNLSDFPTDLVVDDEDTVWVFDACSYVYRIKGDEAVRLPNKNKLLPYYTDGCPPFRFLGLDVYDSILYAVRDDEIWSVPDLTQPNEGIKIDDLPEEAKGLANLVASNEGTFWGWRGSHVEKELWTIENILDPANTSTTWRVGQLPERFPNVAGMAMYTKGEPAPVSTGPFEPPTFWRGLTIAAEERCSAYDPNDYSYSQSLEEEIVATMDGAVYGPYTGTHFNNMGETDIEHVVARPEAHDSGLCRARPEERVGFASDLLNLTLASPMVNRYEKSTHDAAEWMPKVNQCWFADRVVQVRLKYGLTIDQQEADALEAVLSNCSSYDLEVYGE